MDCRRAIFRRTDGLMTSAIEAFYPGNGRAGGIAPQATQSVEKLRSHAERANEISRV